MPIIKTYYKVHRVFPDPDYFYMENVSGNSLIFYVNKNGTPNSTDLSYSLDKVTWTDIHNGGTISNVTDGTKVYFRSSTGFNKDVSNYYSFNSGGVFDVGGHIATLIDYTSVDSMTSIPPYSLFAMLKDGRERHANIDFDGITDIGEYGCYKMFQNGQYLITIPDFSGVTSIGTHGFDALLGNCQVLQTPADLSSVTSVGTFGLSSLYENSSLVNDVIAPNLNEWNTTNMSRWLSGVAATGVVRKPAGLTIPTDTDSGVPTGWTTENY